MADDTWQTRVTRAAATAIVHWLEARGRLNQPIRPLTLADLDAMAAAAAAASRSIVLASERVKDEPDVHPDRGHLLRG